MTSHPHPAGEPQVSASTGSVPFPWQSLIESSEDAIIGTTLTGQILSWNPAAERTFGYSFDEVKGLPITILLPAEANDTFTEMFHRIKQGQRLDHYEAIRSRKDGRKIDVSLTVSPIRDDAGQLIGASIIARDISDRKRREEERERLVRDLQEALDTIKHLRGLLPLCCACKKIRNDQGYWCQLESYFSAHSDLEFTHSICPECANRLYPDRSETKEPIGPAELAGVPVTSIVPGILEAFQNLLDNQQAPPRRERRGGERIHFVQPAKVETNTHGVEQALTQDISVSGIRFLTPHNCEGQEARVTISFSPKQVFVFHVHVVRSHQWREGLYDNGGLFLDFARANGTGQESRN